MSDMGIQAPFNYAMPLASHCPTDPFYALQNLSSAPTQMQFSVPQQAAYYPVSCASNRSGIGSSAANMGHSGHAYGSDSVEQSALSNLRMYSDYCTMGVQNTMSSGCHVSEPVPPSHVSQRPEDLQTRVPHVSHVSSRLATARRHLHEAKKEVAPVARRIQKEDPQRLRAIARMVSQQTPEACSGGRTPLVENAAVTIFHSHGSEGQSASRLGELHAKAAAGTSGGRLAQLIAHARVPESKPFLPFHAGESGYAVSSSSLLFPQGTPPAERCAEGNRFSGVESSGYSQHGLRQVWSSGNSFVREIPQRQEQQQQQQQQKKKQESPQRLRRGISRRDSVPVKKEAEGEAAHEMKSSTTRLSELQKARFHPKQGASTLRHSYGNAEPSDPSIPHLVLDTCSILHASKLQLRDLMKNNVLCIPFSVLEELDKMNKRHNDNANKARDAKQFIARRMRDWIASVMNEKNVRLQRRSEVIEAFEVEGTNNDDSILGFAVFLSRKELRKVFFISEDKILRIKATAELGSSYELKDILYLDLSEPKKGNFSVTKTNEITKGKKQKKK